MDAPPLPPPPDQMLVAGPPAVRPAVGPAFPYAGFWQRFAALLIDGLVFLPVFIPFFIYFWNQASTQIDTRAPSSFDIDAMRWSALFGWTLAVGLLRYTYEVVMIG